MTVREFITTLRHDMLVDYICKWADEDPKVFGHQVKEWAKKTLEEVNKKGGTK